jgi:hypothetical protein
VKYCAGVSMARRIPVGSRQADAFSSAVMFMVRAAIHDQAVQPAIQARACTRSARKAGALARPPVCMS